MQISVVHPVVETSRYVCNVDFDRMASFISAGGTILVDAVINVFITTRLSQILIKAHANRNGFTSRSANSKNKENNILLAVIIWNILQSFVAWSLDTSTVCRVLFSITKSSNEIDFAAYALKTFFSISMSYLVTMDTKIVKMIEVNISKEGEKENTKDIENIHKSL